MSKKRYKNGKSKREEGGFLAFPLKVANSVAYTRLSPHARMLLIDLAVQYRGDNNGDLAAPWRLMKVRGWKSQGTLSRAKKELLNSGLIVQTRMGMRPNRASLYATTWWALDHCAGKLELLPREFQFGKWRASEPPFACALPALPKKSDL